MIATDKAPKALGPYSQGCVHNGMLYSAGQIAINPVTNTVEDVDIAYEIRHQYTSEIYPDMQSLMEALEDDLIEIPIP